MALIMCLSLCVAPAADSQGSTPPPPVSENTRAEVLLAARSGAEISGVKGRLLQLSRNDPQSGDDLALPNAEDEYVYVLKLQDERAAEGDDFPAARKRYGFKSYKYGVGIDPVELGTMTDEHYRLVVMEERQLRLATDQDKVADKMLALRPAGVVWAAIKAHNALPRNTEQVRKLTAEGRDWMDSLLKTVCDEEAGEAKRRCRREMHRQMTTAPDVGRVVRPAEGHAGGRAPAGHGRLDRQLRGGDAATGAGSERRRQILLFLEHAQLPTLRDRAATAVFCARAATLGEPVRGGAGEGPALHEAIDGLDFQKNPDAQPPRDLVLRRVCKYLVLVQRQLARLVLYQHYLVLIQHILYRSHRPGSRTRRCAASGRSTRRTSWRRTAN